MSSSLCDFRVLPGAPAGGCCALWSAPMVQKHGIESTNTQSEKAACQWKHRRDCIISSLLKRCYIKYWQKKRLIFIVLCTVYIKKGLNRLTLYSTERIIHVHKEKYSRFTEVQSMFIKCIIIIFFICPLKQKVCSIIDKNWFVLGLYDWDLLSLLK